MKTPTRTRFRKSFCHVVAATLAVSPMAMYPTLAHATLTPMVLSPVPLFVTTGSKANILLILDNSNSMDENASGAAVGSDNANSKSEIARSAAKTIVANYTGKINMGLMAYKQSNVTLQHLHNSLYDVSYNPTNSKPLWDLAASAGARASQTDKKYSFPNPTSPGDSIYYNISLPFYANGNLGTAFCYSATADASILNPLHPRGFWNTEDPVTGPWDTYQCYSTKTGTSDAAPGGGGGYANALFNSQLFPTDSDDAQQIRDFGKRLMWSHVGLTWFSSSLPGRGYLHVPIKALDATQAGKLNTKLGTSQFVNNGPTDATKPLQNAGETPMEGTLLTARDYFAGGWNVATEGYVNGCYPLPVSCGKNFVVLLSDGLPSTKADGTKYTGDDPTDAINGARDAVTALRTAGVLTYVIGFAMPAGTNANQLNSLAAAGGTGTAYSADNPAALQTVFNSIFTDIMARVGSAAAVATNSTAVNTGSYVFQAKFDATDWSGQLLAYALATDGTPAATATWNGENTIPAANSRKIITYKPSSDAGIPFVWPADAAAPTGTELDITQTTALTTSSVLTYLRGDDSNEGTSAGQFRRRPNTKLGDIVNSSPVYVGKPNAGYAESIESASYSSYVSSKASRTAVVYVGGNDGMLHAFKASDGAELLAYVPGAVYGNLAQLSSQTYSHRYFVDGSPTVGDAYVGGQWRTMLVAGLNGGGQGIFALDISDPSIFSETNASNIARWEFTDRDRNSVNTTLTNFDADLGYTYSQPMIGKMHDGSWVAVFGNGYNNIEADGAASSSGNAVLYIVDLWTGDLIKKIDTKTSGSTTPNGLSSPVVVDVDNDEIIDYIYAGDLRGNMWKFDVTSSNTSSWGVAYGTNNNPQPLFQAKIGTTPQPITERPEVGEHPAGGYFVYFGTGKYLETGDNTGTGQTTQTFYAIWDNGATVSGRSALLQQQIVKEIDYNGSSWRMSTSNTPDWTGNTPHLGWYIDLYNTDGNNTNNYGERQVSNPILQNGRIIFTTLIPSANVCDFGGSSWLMELTAVSGSQLAVTPFDVNGDNAFNSSDYCSAGSACCSSDCAANVNDKKAVSGTKLNGGIVGTPAIETCPGGECKYMSQSSGALKMVKESQGVGRGRISWREIVPR